MTKKDKMVIGALFAELGIGYILGKAVFGKGVKWLKNNSEHLLKLYNRLGQLNSIITEKEDKDELKLLQNSYNFIMKKVNDEAFIRAKQFNLDRLTYEMLCLTDRVNKLSCKYGLENI